MTDEEALQRLENELEAVDFPEPNAKDALEYVRARLAEKPVAAKDYE